MKILFFFNISILMLLGLRLNDTGKNVEITKATVVPVTAVTAGSKGNIVVLSWSGKNSIGNTRYEIERSFYSDRFTPIATLDMPFNNEMVSNYCINDKAPDLSARLIVRYRIKQIASDGTVTYSEARVVNLKEAGVLKDLGEGININFAASKNGNALVKVKDITGHLSKTISTLVTSGNNIVDLSILNGFPKGIYITEVLINGEIADTQKIVVD